MTGKVEQIEKLVAGGAERLIARATDCHGLDALAVIPRLKSALHKYVLRDDPNASAQCVSRFLDALQADDLCLIVACERGDPSAWNDLVQRFSTTVRSAARAASSNEQAAEELAQSIWAELHGLRSREDGRPAGKLAYYSGRGSLAGWLRAVVAQLAVDQHRILSRLVQADDDADFDRIRAEVPDGVTVNTRTRTPDPEELISTKLVGGEINRALEHALRKLPAEDRLLIKLYYFDGLRLREAGAVLGIHEATASRRLTRIQKQLHDQVESILIDTQGWSKAETERAFAEVAVNLQADLEPLLANEAPSNPLDSGR